MRSINLLFILLSVSVGSLFSQSPGGVGKPELWFMTVPSGTDLQGNYRWKDFSGENLRLNTYNDKGASTGVEFTTNTVRFVNGYPAINMDKSLDHKTRNVRMKRSGLYQSTLIGLFMPTTSYSREFMLYSLYSRPGEGVWVSNDKVYSSNESGKDVFDYGKDLGMDLRYTAGDAEGSEEAYKRVAARIAAYYRSMVPATSIWGDGNRAVITFGGTPLVADVNKNSTFTTSSTANNVFVGFIPEFIVYSRLLTPLERRKVDTYLAIKYGITLSVSYIGSGDQLLWDPELNPNFNNRITGIYRDDASEIYQAVATTLNEDLPLNTANDDYYNASNPYDKSSGSRLLNISLQTGRNIPDKGYQFWSDDNKAIKFTSLDNTIGTQMMERTWLMKTNLTSNEFENLEWKISNLTYSASNKRKEIVVENKYATTKGKEGALISPKPLEGNRGAIILKNVAVPGKLYFKFGSNQATYTGADDYGYSVNTIGSIIPIREGKLDARSIGTTLSGDIEMEKVGNLIFLRKDGIRLAGSEITINPLHENNKFYAGIFVGSTSLQDSKLTVGHGGFVDTGNTVELSYASSRIAMPNPLTLNASGGNLFLVIDPTGRGDFSQGNANYIPSTGYDIRRSKYIFDNVYFDTDHSGEDLFTFFIQESAITGDIEVEEPTCHNADGSITLKLRGGSPAFDWTLKDLQTNEIVKSGKSYKYEIHIDSVSGGDYEIEIKEAGGYGMTNDNIKNTPNRAKTTNAFPVFKGNIQWPITSTKDTYMIGWTNFLEDVSDPRNIIHYGLKKEGNKIYKIVEGKLEKTDVTVEEGDVIRIQKEMGKVFYFKNEVQFSVNSIKWYDVALKFYGLVDMSYGKAEIYNVQAEGFFNLVDYDWNCTQDIDLGRAVGAKSTFKVTVNDPCGNNGVKSEIPDNVTRAQAKVQDGRFVVSGVPGTIQITAHLELDQPQPVSFIVYDLNGNLVTKVENKNSEKIQEAHISVYNAGIYIIKAITPTEDFSCKTIIQ